MSQLNVNNVAPAAGGTPTELDAGLAKVYATVIMAASLSDSLNVSSITDTGTGDFGINITNNMSSAAYNVECGILVTGLNPRQAIPDNRTASLLDVRCMNTTDGAANEANITDANIAAFGNLA